MHVDGLVGRVARGEQLGTLGARRAGAAGDLGVRFADAAVLVVRADRPTGAGRRRVLADRPVDSMHRRPSRVVVERRGVERRTRRRRPGLHGGPGAAIRLHHRIDLEWIGAARYWRRRCRRHRCLGTGIPCVQLARPRARYVRSCAAETSATHAVHAGRHHPVARCGTTNARRAGRAIGWPAESYCAGSH